VIQLPNVDLPRHATRWLARWQSEIDQLGDYALMVDSAKRTFKARNVKTNATFAAVRRALSLQCSGRKRCGYCEDSMADEIEHLRPKDLYPEQTFVWSNYIYACGPCNAPKGNRYAVFTGKAAEFCEVARGANDPVLPPPKGDPLLIDPRAEDPLTFMALDLKDTFLFLPLGAEASRQYRRADYTIGVLHLNDRPDLVAARIDAYAAYEDRLARYVAAKQTGEPRDGLRNTADSIHNMSHPTVWREMKRQHDMAPHLKVLRGLFLAAPEALNW